MLVFNCQDLAKRAFGTVSEGEPSSTPIASLVYRHPGIFILKKRLLCLDRMLHAHGQSTFFLQTE